MAVLNWSDKTQVAAYMRDYYLTHDGAKRSRIIPGATRVSKTCRKCGVLKYRDEFTVRQSGSRIGHLSGHCKTCNSASQGQRYQVKVERDPQHYQRFERPSKLKRMYGITVAQYGAMLAAQGGACSICGSTSSRACGYKRNGSAAFCVDHDHKTGRVRGLLCTLCNRAIGLIGDDPEAARRMVKYLEQETTLE